MKVLAATAFIQFLSIDFSTGNDLESLKTNTARLCEESCEKVEACKGYVYNPNTKGCWLKDNLNGIRPIHFVVNAGIKVNDQ